MKPAGRIRRGMQFVRRLIRRKGKKAEKLKIDLSQCKTDVLIDTVNKRQIDLLVIGADLQLHRGKLDPERREVIDNRIASLVVSAEELTRRGQKVHLDISKQPPVIQEMLLGEIKKRGLLKKLKIEGAVPERVKRIGRK